MHKLIPLLYVLLSAICLYSCSSEDVESNGKNDIINNISIDKVFTYRRPIAVDDITHIYYDEKGRVSSMQTEYGEVLFSYKGIDFTDADYDVKMSITEEGMKYDLLMVLNKDGFVERCTQTFYTSPQTTEYWNFTYNDNLQLDYMKRSEGGNEETFITYKNGDITDVSGIDNSSTDRVSAHILYSSGNQSPLDNKGNIMFFDVNFQIDMDEMKYAYYAGLLGRSAQHLPMAYDLKEGSYHENNQIFWQLDSSQCPYAMEVNGWSHPITLSAE